MDDKQQNYDIEKEERAHLYISSIRLGLGAIKRQITLINAVQCPSSSRRVGQSICFNGFDMRAFGKPRSSGGVGYGESRTIQYAVVHIFDSASKRLGQTLGFCLEIAVLVVGGECHNERSFPSLESAEALRFVLQVIFKSAEGSLVNATDVFVRGRCRGGTVDCEECADCS